jgi:hypothetical protein
MIRFGSKKKNYLREILQKLLCLLFIKSTLAFFVVLFPDLIEIFTTNLSSWFDAQLLAVVVPLLDQLDRKMMIYHSYKLNNYNNTITLISG